MRSSFLNNWANVNVCFKKIAGNKKWILKILDLHSKPTPMAIRIYVTGGALDKEYYKITGSPDLLMVFTYLGYLTLKR